MISREVFIFTFNIYIAKNCRFLLRMVDELHSASKTEKRDWKF